MANVGRLWAALGPWAEHQTAESPAESQLQIATALRCRFRLFLIKAPRKRGAPCALGAALLAALERRHRQGHDKVCFGCSKGC